jgi:hypothetical protein
MAQGGSNWLGKQEKEVTHMIQPSLFKVEQI